MKTLRECWDKRLTVKETCTKVKVSERSVQKYFREFAQITKGESNSLRKVIPHRRITLAERFIPEMWK